MSNIIYLKLTDAPLNTGSILIAQSILDILVTKGNVFCFSNIKSRKFFLTELNYKEKCLFKSNNLTSVNILINGFINRFFLKRKVFLFTGFGGRKVSGIRDVVKNIISIPYLFLLKCAGVRVIRIGGSLSIKGNFASLTEKIITSLLDICYLRDSVSKKNCLDFGIKNIKIAPDLSWSYESESIIKYSSAQNNLGLVFSDTVLGVNRKDLTNSIFNFVKLFLREHNNGIVYIGYQVYKDDSFAKFLYSNLEKKYPGRIQFNPLQIKLGNAVGFYKVCDYVLSNRLHSLLLCYKYGCLPIPLIDKINQQKIEATFEDCRLEDLIRYIDTDNYNLPDYNNIYRLFSVQEQNKKQLNIIISNIFQEKD